MTVPVAELDRLRSEERNYQEQIEEITVLYRIKLWLTCILTPILISWVILARSLDFYDCFSVPILLVLLISWSLSAMGALSAHGTAAMVSESRPNRNRLLFQILSGKPYTLYLRDFSSELQKEEEGPPGVLVLQRDGVEDSLVSTVGQRMPIYGLVNFKEAYGGGGILRVPVTTEDWPTYIEAYAAHAALIVFNIDRITDNLLLELDILERRNLGRRVFLSVTETMKSLLEQNRPSFIAQTRWIATRRPRTGDTFSPRAHDVPIPPDLLDFLDAQHPSARRYEVKRSTDIDDVTALTALTRKLAQLPPPSGGDEMLHVSIRVERDGG